MSGVLCAAQAVLYYSLSLNMDALLVVYRSSSEAFAMVNLALGVEYWPVWPWVVRRLFLYQV